MQMQTHTTVTWENNNS